MAVCVIPGCGASHLAKGFCRKHYLRNYRHGDPLTKLNPRDYIPSGPEAPMYKHGLWNHALYKTWRNMWSRCENPMDAAYINYGGRGIVVCPEWRDISTFVADMGPKPPGYTLERKDNTLGYNPKNCIWADYTTQSRNRRYCKLTLERATEMRSHRAAGATRKELARLFGVSEATVKKVISGVYWKPINTSSPTTHAAQK